VEEGVLALLADGSLAPEQIAANLRADEATVRATLDELRARGLVEVLAITLYESDLSTAAAYWRITDAGRAQLESLRDAGD
jgi:predicted ArsR family transcriptional regulator